MIAKVYFWSNGMMMVFDEHGQQMPEYQGRANESLAAILRDAPAAAEFHIGDWQNGTVPTTRGALARLSDLFGPARASAPGTEGGRRGNDEG